MDVVQPLWVLLFFFQLVRFNSMIWYFCCCCYSGSVHSCVINKFQKIAAKTLNIVYTLAIVIAMVTIFRTEFSMHTCAYRTCWPQVQWNEEKIGLPRAKALCAFFAILCLSFSLIRHRHTHAPQTCEWWMFVHVTIIVHFFHSLWVCWKNWQRRFPSINSNSHSICLSWDFVFLNIFRWNGIKNNITHSTYALNKRRFF